MISPSYDGRAGEASAKNAALTASARGARRAVAAPPSGAPANGQGEQAVAFAQRTRNLWTVPWLRAEKPDVKVATIQHVEIQYPRYIEGAVRRLLRAKD